MARRVSVLRMIHLFSFWGERERKNNDFGTQKQMILLFARADPIGVGTHFSAVDPGRGAGRSTV